MIDRTQVEPSTAYYWTGYDSFFHVILRNWWVFVRFLKDERLSSVIGCNDILTNENRRIRESTTESCRPQRVPIIAAEAGRYSAIAVDVQSGGGHNRTARRHHLPPSTSHACSIIDASVNRVVRVVPHPLTHTHSLSHKSPCWRLPKTNWTHAMSQRIEAVPTIRPYPSLPRIR